MANPGEDLLNRAANGDRDALARLLEQHAPAARRLLVGKIPRRWRSALSVDDVMQQTYIDAFVDIDRFVPHTNGSFAAWLASLAKCNLLDALKMLEADKRGNDFRRIELRSPQDSFITLHELVRAPGTSPSGRVARDEACAVLKWALEQLTEVYRQVVRMYDLEGRSAEEVGRPLPWGDGEALVELTRLTGYRQGFGNRLAEGSYRLAESCGHPELAMVSKKQEFPGYEPRGAQAMGLAYATSPIGGSHMRGDPADFELFGVPQKADPHQWKGKAKITKAFQDLSAAIDSAGLCIFFAVRNLAGKTLEVPPVGILEYLNAATGADYTLEELIRASERIITAERQFLVRSGMSRKDDSLPKRLTHEPMPAGPAAGLVCHLEEMLDDYYREQGWTPDGIPTPERLAALGLA